MITQAEAQALIDEYEKRLEVAPQLGTVYGTLIEYARTVVELHQQIYWLEERELLSADVEGDDA